MLIAMLVQLLWYTRTRTACACVCISVTVLASVFRIHVRRVVSCGSTHFSSQASNNFIFLARLHRFEFQFSSFIFHLAARRMYALKLNAWIKDGSDVGVGANCVVLRIVFQSDTLNVVTSTHFRFEKNYLLSSATNYLPIIRWFFYSFSGLLCIIRLQINSIDVSIRRQYRDNSGEGQTEKKT